MQRVKRFFYVHGLNTVTHKKPKDILFEPLKISINTCSLVIIFYPNMLFLTWFIFFCWFRFKLDLRHSFALKRIKFLFLVSFLFLFFFSLFADITLKILKQILKMQIAKQSQCFTIILYI